MNEQQLEIGSSKVTKLKNVFKQISMSKRVEKSLKALTNTNTNSRNLLSASNDNYKLTGKFKDDFENVCASRQIKYIPDVVTKYKRPNSSNPNVNGGESSKQTQDKLAKGAAAKSSNKPANDKENLLKDVDELEGSDEPRSFVIRESYEYFKPKLYCELDNVDKWETVNEIHVKGWKLEKSILEVLQLCLPRVTYLNTLNLWNCGLDEQAIRTITSFLPECHNLNVQNISLRNNNLDDDAIQAISFGLGDIKRHNTKIINLNLNNNRISNKGAICLARALRTNRTLLTLSLTNNYVEDEGAQAFAYVLSRFPLTHEEILHRRQVKSNVNFDEFSLPLSRRGNGDSKERPPSQKSQLQGPATMNRDKKSATKKDAAPTAGMSKDQAANKNTKDAGSKAKKDDKAGGAQRKDVKAKDGLSTVDAKSVKQVKAGVLQKQSATKSDKEKEKVDKALLEISALTDVAEYINDELWLAGNRNLLSLNLSRNKLTIKSVDSFVLALQHQKTLLDIYKGIGQGLLRLILNYNDFKIDHESYIKLNEILKTRDPIYKPLVQEQDISDKASVHSGGKESSLGKSTKNKH